MSSARPRKRESIAPRVLVGSAIGIVGLGQIGGSILRRLSQYRPVITLYGVDRDAHLAKPIRRFGRWRESLPDVIRECDVLILAVPVPEIMRLLPKVAECVRGIDREKRLIVLDTGTVKAPIHEAAQHFAPWFDFAGLHPLAGTEKNGWGGSSARLFLDWRIVHCPSPSTRANRVARELIKLLGGIPLTLDAREHDTLLAEAIGLPHVLAFAAGQLGERSRSQNPLRGNSWQSLTRVTDSSSEMVAGFLKANAADLVKVLKQFQRSLTAISSSIEDPQVSSRALSRTLKKGG